jgi:hypothetical protein
MGGAGGWRGRDFYEVGVRDSYEVGVRDFYEVMIFLRSSA